MTDYAKHIETLGHIGLLRIEAREAITAAIELMRAAVPLNEEAERARLNTLVCRWLTDNDPRDGGLVGLFESEIAAARAEGRALEREEIDLRANGEMLRVLNANEGLASAAMKWRDELAAAKAEIAALLKDRESILKHSDGLASRLSERTWPRSAYAEREIARIRREANENTDVAVERVADRLMDSTASLRSELAAAKAEIERLRIDSATFLDSANELNTKLTNLLAAAERVAEDWRKPLGGHQVALKAAIEASR